MFAAATREVVFSNPEVVRRVNEEFIPVALKAGLVNNPPRGIEGELYAEIGRSKPAPQGICTVNSEGKVLAWALSFDDDASIVKFLDHVVARYKQSPNAEQSVTAERYRLFPSLKLPDVEDIDRRLTIPGKHESHERCPALPAVRPGTVVGRIIGRPLDDTGKPIADTSRQEHYMEARFEISANAQQQLADAIAKAAGKRFRIPSDFALKLVEPAYLGQLDVNPMRSVPDSRRWDFAGQIVDSDTPRVVRIHVNGGSQVAGHKGTHHDPRPDRAYFDHRVSLEWQGYIDVKDGRVVALTMIANGDERLRWGNDRFNFVTESATKHLMAGHPIDLNSRVRYGLVAGPAADNEIVSR